MAIFLVVPLRSESKALDTAIAERIEMQDRYQLQAGRGWLIRFDGTTREASERIGITGQKDEEKPVIGSAIVTPVTSYYGRGPTDMWEWLKSRFEK